MKDKRIVLCEYFIMHFAISSIIDDRLFAISMTKCAGTLTVVRWIPVQ